MPNRSNYIHWIEDLLASDIIEKNNADGGKVRGFDIGTGANCIYPLLGASLLGWSFVGSDMTEVALEWAEKNIKSNPHISELIEIRRVDVADPTGVSDIVESSGCKIEDNSLGLGDGEDLANPELKELDDSVATSEVEADLNETRFDEAERSNVDKGYQGPPILLGVVKEGEKFDFCMCNPPFFEGMEEAGLNPKTSCGGTPEEMVCQGGERAFISRIIEDSSALKQSIRWYTSMVGKKSNLKFLMSKLREKGVTIVKTTEFVQGQTCRWGLAWSFMPAAKRLVSSHVVEKSNLSFMLEGLHRQTGAFNVLQSLESFFNHFGASCKSNPSSFTVDVSVSNDCCDAISKTDVKELDEATTLPNVAESSSSASSHDPLTFSFRISVFQQIPGTLLVRGSLQQRDSPLSGAFTSVFQQLEEFLRHKFCRQKESIPHHNPR